MELHEDIVKLVNSFNDSDLTANDQVVDSIEDSM